MFCRSIRGTVEPNILQQNSRSNNAKFMFIDFQSQDCQFGALKIEHDLFRSKKKSTITCASPCITKGLGDILVNKILLFHSTSSGIKGRSPLACSNSELTSETILTFGKTPWMGDLTLPRSLPNRGSYKKEQKGVF